jgi:hypothetical protein
MLLWALSWCRLTAAAAKSQGVFFNNNIFESNFVCLGFLESSLGDG